MSPGVPREGLAPGRAAEDAAAGGTPPPIGEPTAADGPADTGSPPETGEPSGPGTPRATREPSAPGTPGACDTASFTAGRTDVPPAGPAAALDGRKDVAGNRAFAPAPAAADEASAAAPRAVPANGSAPAGPSLRRRLMRVVLLATPALWGLSMLLSFLIAHQEIDEMADAELVRLAQQLVTTLPHAQAAGAGAARSAAGAEAPARTSASPVGATAVARDGGAAVPAGAADGPGGAAAGGGAPARGGGAPPATEGAAPGPASPAPSPSAGPRAAPGAEAARHGGEEPKDLLVVVWDAAGRRLPVQGRDAQALPYRAGRRGFEDLALRRSDWRVFYLPTGVGGGLVAVAQRVGERRELVRSLAFAPLVPWLLTLPLLLLALAAGLERVLRPLRRLSAELASRAADDLRPLDTRDLPADLQPLVAATNAQFARVAGLLERERRFTADAAHELRTPLAVLQAQWDAALLASGGAPLPEPLRRLGDGLARLSRLVTQMLLLSRIEHRQDATPRRPIDWTALVGEAFDDALPLAERRGVELACEDLSPGQPRLPLQGDAPLLLALLRNLLDNALRHSPRGGQVTLRFGTDRLEVLDEGPGVPPEHLVRLGDRFYRPPGQLEPGSGLGLSIVRRIARWHGLAVDWGPRDDGPGFRVRLRRAASEAPVPAAGDAA